MATPETRLPDGQPMAPRDAPVGGQAVLEGVMMRGRSSWAVALRKPSESDRAGDVVVRSFPLVSWTERRRVYRWPVVRGVVALAQSLSVGFRALTISADAQLPEGQEPISGHAQRGTVALALALVVGLFFVVPAGLTALFADRLGSGLPFWLAEGVIRIAILLAYVVVLSRRGSLRRVLEYHGAEHKTIACHEAGLALTPEHAGGFSRLHPRCGTSFLLVVMVVAVAVFAPIGQPAWPWLLASRILGVPLIAGLSFELIRFAGRNRHRTWVHALTWPGLQLQRLTTREPDRAQLAVAIAALEAVLAVEQPPRAVEVDKVGMEVVA